MGLMCVHAHPDDESIFTGGILARAAQEGRRTRVVTCTAGEEGEIVGAGMDADQLRPRLGEVRRAELAGALAALGAGEPHLLGYRDSGMAGTAANEGPQSFVRADVDEAVGRVVAEIRAFRPEVVVTYDALGVYGHPDHVRAHRVALLAAEASAFAALYPEAGDPWRVRKVYLATVPRGLVAIANAELPRRGLVSPFGTETDPDRIHLGTPDNLVHARVDVSAHLDAKRAAMACHRTQVGPGSFFMDLPDDLAAIAFAQESFVRQRSDIAVPWQEHDLFAGLG